MRIRITTVVTHTIQAHWTGDRAAASAQGRFTFDIELQHFPASYGFGGQGKVSKNKKHLSEGTSRHLVPASYLKQE